MGTVLSFEELLEAVQVDRAAGKRIVATNGCFDLLHVGHARVLRDAKALGDVLVVGVNSDASVRENKTEGRPFIPEAERAELIASLASTDYVFIFHERTPFDWIRRLRPDIHVKGGGADVQAHPDFAEQKRVVEKAGGELVLLPHHDGKSTTTLAEKIRKDHSTAPS
jgi:rfaE bifunctional protein nucleotidyltransferase chain/domain